MGFGTDGVTKVQWKSGKNGRKYQLMIRFNYKELATGSTDTVFKKLDWLFPSIRTENLAGDELMEMSYSNPYFYDLIKSKILVKPGIQRFFGKKGASDVDYGVIEFIFSVASDEFSTYLDVYEPSTGLVQEKPDYTNITADGTARGLGLFSPSLILMHASDQPMARQQLLPLEVHLLTPTHGILYLLKRLQLSLILLQVLTLLLQPMLWDVLILQV